MTSLLKRIVSDFFADRRQASVWLFAALAALIALWITADTLLMVVRTYSPLPYWDQWDSLMDYQRLRQGDFPPSDLFAQHNEHRMAAPRLIFWADYALGGGVNKLNLAVIGLIQAAHAAMLISLSGPRWKEARSWIVAATVVALLMSLGQWENFTWGFQSQFVGVFALATGAYILIVKAAGASGRRRGLLFASALGLLFVATFTMANGLVAAAIAVLLCLVIGAPWWMAVGTAAYVVIAGLAYFHGYHSVSSHSSLAFALSRPFDYITYCLSYLGNPLSEHLLWEPLGQPQRLHLGATLLGAAGVVLGAAAILIVLLRRGADRAQVVLVGLMLFVLSSAAITAMGRLNFGIEQAYSSRYHTPSSLFWAAQIVFWSRAKGVWGGMAQRAAVAASIIVLIGLAGLQHLIKPDVYGKATTVHLAEATLLAGAADIQALDAGAYPQGGVARQRIDILRNYGKSIFTEPRGQWVGQDLSRVGPTRPGACLGAFDSVARSPSGNIDGLRAVGWAWDRDAHRAARDIVLTDDRMRVVGVARTGERRPDVRAALHYPWAIDSGWQGVAIASGPTLHAFAVLHDGGVCAIGDKSTLAVPAQISIRSLSRADIGPAIATTAGPLASNGPWLKGGISPSAVQAPAGMSSYGSWAGADSNAGVIIFGPLRTDHAAIALGLITGPDSSGQAILIKDAETNEVLSVLYMATYQSWTWMRLDLPEKGRGRPLLIEAIDQGAGWGQWMGITEPRAVVGAAAP